MKYKILIIFILLISIQVSIAQEFEISVEPESQNTSYREAVDYLIKINNKDSKERDFRIFVDSRPGWATYSRELLVDANSEANTSLKIFPTNDIGEFNFKVNVYPKENESLKKIEPFSIFVSHPDGVLLKNDIIIKEWEDGRISINLPIKTTETKDVNIIAEILSLSDEVLKTTKIDRQVNGDERVFEYLNIEDLNAGDYKLRVRILDTNNTIIKNFSIAPISNVDVSEIKEENTFFGKVTIKIENLGNIVENNYSYFVDIPKTTPVNFLTDPFSSKDKGNIVTYEFRVNDLKPGESVEITYRLDYWQSVLLSVGVIVIVIVIILWYLNNLRKPKLKKKFIVKKKGEYTVILDIKGSFFRKLGNVVIRDWVTPLAKVQQKFESLKPVVRSSSAGTELIWKLGDIHKGEERVVHYVIKPTVSGGSLKMPKAYIRFSPEGSDKQKKIFSNSIVIEIKEKKK